MTESGNTFESQEPAGSDAEETNNAATTDATNPEAAPAEAPTETPAAPHVDAVQPSTAPVIEAAAPVAEAPAVAAEAPAVESPAAAAPAAEAPAAEAPVAAAPVADTPVADAPVAAAPDGAPTPEAAAEGEAGAEAGSGEGGEGAHDEGEGSRRSRGRQLPKIPEEEMRLIWAELATKKGSGEEIEIEVISTNRGGVVGSYRGVEVFIPVSHWSLDRHNTDAISGVSQGDKLAAHVLEITAFDTDARRVTATRRTLLRKDLMGSLVVGQKMKGRVASILDFGAFVDLGGVDGLVHASEISFDRTRKPSELLSKGDEVEVVIREIDREKKRIYLSMKDLLPSPWEGVEDRFAIGSIQNGKVVGIGKNGAFIELEPGLEGFVRVSELSWTKRINNPKEVLRKGMDVEVKVLDASSRKQRLSLSYRQAQPDPWSTIAETHAVGTAWEGEVREISNKGVVVSVGDVEGFLPRGRMGREARKLTEMKVGDKLNVNVIEVNPATHSLIFGLPMPEGEGGGGGGERSDRRGGGGGGGRDGDRRGGDRRGDRDRERTGGPVTPVNEMKSADTVTNFTLGDLINDAIKKQLNYAEPKPAPAEPAAPPVAAAPAAPVAAAPAAEAPAAEAAPVAEAPLEAASVEAAPAAASEPAPVASADDAAPAADGETA